MRTILALLLLCGAAIAQSPPNIVLAVLDDTDVTQFGFLGAPVQTPNLDRLAANGVVLRNVYCPAAVCRPVLASVLCGQRPERHGVYFNIAANQAQVLPAARSLPKLLKDAGYATAVTGKWWEPQTASYGVDQWVNCGSAEWSTAVRSDHQRRVCQFVRDASAASNPFFLFWGPLLPHTPHDASSTWTQLYPPGGISVPPWFAGNAATYQQKEAGYRSMLTWTDHELGRLVGLLSFEGLLDNTVLVVLVDNGWRVGLPSKDTPYEAGVKSLVIVHWPAGLEPGESSELVSLVDLYPTLLGYAGVVVPSETQATDISGIIAGGAQVGADQFGAVYPAAAYANQTYATDAGAIWGRSGNFKYVEWLKEVTETAGPNWYATVEATTWTPRPAGTVELYDLSADPREQTNLASNPAYGFQLEELQAATRAWWDVPPPPPSASLIVDNGDAGFGTVGSWSNWSAGHQGDLVYAAGGSGSSVATWTFAGLTAGQYRVAATWVANPNRATNAPFTVYDGATALGTVPVNQELAPSDFTDSGVGWKDLGTFTIAGTTLVVRLTNAANEYVIADAVRIDGVP